MRRLFTLILTLIGLTEVRAQQVHLDFQDAPLSCILAQIDELYPDTHIHFILDEVIPFQVSCHISCDNLHTAVSQAIAGLPLIVRTEGHDLFINRCETSNESNLPRNPADAIRSYYLQEVFVYKRLSDLLSTDEGLIIDLNHSDLQHRGTAIDVLSYLPGLSYSSGQIRNYNATSPTIYIDDVEVNTSTELFSLRSEEISRVAYVESANSTYQSNNGGVVKIYTKTAAKGWNVQMQSATSVGHKVSQGEQARVSWNDDRMQLHANVGYQQNNEYQEHHAPDFDATLTPKIPSVNTQFQLSYRISPHHLIGAKYDLMGITRCVSYWSRTFSVGGAFDTDNIADLESWEQGDWSLDYQPRHDLRLFYDGKVANSRIRLDLGYYSDAMQIKQQEVIYDNQNNNINSGQRINGINNELLTERLDITLPLGKLDLHIGNEYTSTQRLDTYLRQNWDVARMSMKRAERQSALFALAEGRWKGLQLQMGLRTENLHTISRQASTTIDRKRNYVLPFAEIRLPWDHSEIGVTYSLRTQRPTYDQLNGYTRFNQYMLFISGNPNLEPSMHHRVGLTYRHRSLHLSVNYQHISDYLASIITFVEGVYRMHYANLPSAQELMFTASYTPRFEYWQPIISSTLLAQDVDLTFSNGTHQRLNHPILHLDLHSPFHLSRHAQLWVDGHYRTSGHVGSFLQEATGTIHLSFAYQLRHWDFTLQADDLFKTGTTSFEGYGPGITYHHSTYCDTQRITFTLRYHWR